MAKKWLVIFTAGLLMGYGVHAYAQEKNQPSEGMTVQDFLKEALSIVGLVNSLSEEDAYEKIKSTADIVIIDVGEENEFKAEHLDNAILIPRGLLEMKIGKNDIFPEINKGVTPNKNQPILLYCKVGARSLLAAATLKKMGYKNIYHLKGGLEAWKSANLPLAK